MGAAVGVVAAYAGKTGFLLFPLCAPGVFLLGLMSLGSETGVGLAVPRIGLLVPANALVYGLLGVLGGALWSRHREQRLVHEAAGARAAGDFDGNAVRKARYSAGVSLACAALAFPFLLVGAGFISRVALILVGDTGLLDWDRSGAIVLGMFTALAVVMAYVPARMIYMGLRWERLVDDGRHCVYCGYDLTGNVSGLCPECGGRTRRGQP